MKTAELRKASQAVFLATDEEPVAQDLSTMLKGAADEIDSLRTERDRLKEENKSLRERLKARREWHDRRAC